jgi:hypothetical protein
MIFEALANLGLTGVRPPKDVDRPGSEGQRRRQPGDKSAKREPDGEPRAPHPVLNVQGEVTGKVIDTEA